jgi:ATP-dependent Clp protease ATP-binding subunit ClpB
MSGQLALASGVVNVVPFEPGMVLAQLRTKLVGFEPYLRGQIFGQEIAVREFSEAIKVGELGLGDPGRPLSFMLMVGPTGVGKTEICECASTYLYGTKAIARINCPKLADEHAVLRLVGDGGDDPEGILGAEYDKLMAAGGRILLLDEIEKAHPKVSKLFLGMEAGSIELSNRRLLDLRRIHIVCTSNLGTAQAALMVEHGFPMSYIAETIKAECVKFFSREVLGRFTHFLHFRGLTREVILLIAQKFIKEVQDRLRRTVHFHQVSDIELGPGVFEALAAEGTDPAQGARPMRNAVENRIQSAAMEYLLGSEKPPRGALRLVLKRNGQRGFDLVPIGG